MKLNQILCCKVIIRTIIYLLIFNLFIIKEANVLFGSQEIKITASDGCPSDFFGESVAISDDFIIVGAKCNDEKGNNSGAAYIFHLDQIFNQITSINVNQNSSTLKKQNDIYIDINFNTKRKPKNIIQLNSLPQTGWTKKLKLMKDGAKNFGCSVAISGHYAIIGAENAAYIFHYNGTIWDQQAYFTGATSTDLFGCSVSISGDYAIVGAEKHDSDGLSNSGAAYIFIKDDYENWTQMTKLIALDAQSPDFFGHSVSIQGDYAIIGSLYDDNNKGSAYVFHNGSNGWEEQAKLTAVNRISYDYFGCSVSISDKYAIVGAIHKDNYCGAVYIYTKTQNGDWLLPIKLSPQDLEPNDNFGSSVSLSGNYAIIGAIHDDSDGHTDAGSAYIFHNDNGVWIRKGKIFPSDVSRGDVFGCSVSISNDKIIIGAMNDDDNGNLSGSAYIFDKISTTDWSLPVELTSMTLISQNGNVIIKWKTESEIDNLGFNVYRSLSDTMNFVKLNSYLIQGAGNSSIAHEYSFTDEDVILEKPYYYKLEDISTAGQSKIHKTISITIEMADQNDIYANTYKLYPAYPNPCNPLTTIEYNIPSKCFVDLKMFDVQGNLIKTLTNETMSAGRHQSKWDGSDDNHNQVGNGIYFFNLTTSTGYSNTNKVIFMK